MHSTAAHSLCHSIRLHRQEVAAHGITQVLAAATRYAYAPTTRECCERPPPSLALAVADQAAVVVCTHTAGGIAVQAEIWMIG